MNGYRKAQLETEKNYNLKVEWILSFDRNKEPADLMRAYEESLTHRDIIKGFALAGISDGSRLMKFNEVFTRAREDGFFITAHVEAESPQSLHECLSQVGGHGLDRLDHGLRVGDQQDLIDLIKKRNIGLTLCPWVTYGPAKLMTDHESAVQTVFEDGFRKLCNHEVLVAIGSDDPALVGGRWLEDNLSMLTDVAGFTEEELLNLQLSAVRSSWASDKLKAILDEEIRTYGASFKSP
ncbi:hypothetical protein B0J13DRAFT_653400 [Dactylonectria estremocensis]|uniref:Adenosine deaminase n=1 Tax=Dactylonectria estremocensis TaxID=1079267 RepID=A0A9P9DCI8_9HYPO|nr:hypothetical protein B0J13DRAFT_653400 [Dactylonectria estremocensis]